MKPQSIITLAAAILFFAPAITTRAVDMVINNNTTVSDAVTLTTGSNTFTTDTGMTGTMSGGIGGATDGIFVKLGGGMLTLTANNTYTGATQVLSGTLRLTGRGTFNSLDNIVDGATLQATPAFQIGTSGTASFYASNGGIVEGTSTAVAFVGNNSGAMGTLVASGAGTAIRLSSGTLGIGATGATGRVEILNGATLTVSGLIQVAQNPNGVGYLLVSGAGSTVSATGNVTAGANGTGSIEVTNGGTLTTTANINLVGTLATATAALTVDGANSRVTTQSFSGGNGYATITVSNNAWLQVNTTFTTNSTANTVIKLGSGGLITVANNVSSLNARLTGSGTFNALAGSINTLATTVLAPGVLGSEGIGRLSIGGNLTLNGVTLMFDTAAGNVSDLLAINGNLLFSTARTTLDIGDFNSGTFTVITTTGTIGNTTGVLDIDSIKVRGAAPTARHGIAISVIGDNTVQLVLSATSFASLWTNAGGNGIWDSSAGNTNWSTSNPSITNFADGDFVTFGSANSGTVSITGTVTVSGMNVDGNYRFTGGSIVGDTSARTGLTATGKLTKTGTGTLFLDNSANDFHGGIDIAGGLVVFTNGNQLRATGATLSFSNSGTLRPGANSLTLATDMEIAAGAAATIDTDSSNLTHTGVLSSAASGTLVKAGAGVLTLTGDSSANGGSTRITAGALALASGAKLRGNTAITNGTLLVAGGAALLGNATATGAGASIAGTGTIAGDVSLTGGSLLRIGEDGLGAPGILDITGNLMVDNSTLSFDFVSGTNCLLNVSGNITAAGSNTINVGAASLLSGTYTLGNIGDILNSSAVVVTINNNTQNAASRTKATVSRDTVTPANLLLAYGVDISRRMTWALQGGGTWDASLENWTGDGETVFQNGDTVVFSTSAANATITVANSMPYVSDMLVNNTGTLTIDGLGIHASATTATGSVLATPAGKLTKAGAGALVLDNAANCFEGGIDIGDGTAGAAAGLLVFNHAGQLGVSENTSITFKNNGTLMPGATYAATDLLATNIDINNGIAGTINTAGHDLSYSGTLRASGASAVLQKTGAGTLRLLGDSGNYAGTINIDEGALMLAGGVAGGTINVNSGGVFGGWGAATGAGGVHVWSGGIITPGNTTNALDISNLVFEQNAKLAGQGTLAGAATIKDGVVVTGSVAAGGTLALGGVFTGTGATLDKTGDGGILISATASVHIGTVNLNAGSLVLAATSQIRTKTSLNINEGGILRAAGNSAIILDATSVLTNNGRIEVGRAAGENYPYSTLTINGGRYAGGHGATATGGKISLFVSNTLVSGTMVLADKLVFGPDTTVSGTTWIEIKRNATPSLYAMSEMPDLVEVQGTAEPDTFFKSSEIGQAGSAYNMWFEWTPGESGQWKQDIAAEIPAVTGLDTTAILIGKASVDALGQRLRASHFDLTPYKFELWLNTLYRDDKVKTTRYDNIKSDTRGIQSGAGWLRSKEEHNTSILLGFYYDYASTNMSQPGNSASTKTDSHGFGVYASTRIRAWYADAMARYSWETYDISEKGKMKGDFGTKGKGFLIALQTGAVLENVSRYKIEPNARIAWHTHSLSNATDTHGRVYEIDGADSLETRAGVSLWDEFKWKNDLKIWPRVGVSVFYESQGRTKVEVMGYRYDNNLRGFGTLMDIGVNMQLSRRLTLDIGAAWQFSDSLENLYFNAGISCKW